MRVLNLVFFSTIVTLAIGVITLDVDGATRIESTPEKISPMPSSIMINEPGDLTDPLSDRSNYFLSYSLGQISGYLISVDKVSNSVFAEARINYKKKFDQFLSLGFFLMTPQFLMIELSERHNISFYDELGSFYKVGIAPLFDPSKGVSGLADLKKIQIRFSVGAEELFLKKRHSSAMSAGLELSLGYALNGISGALGINFVF